MCGGVCSIEGIEIVEGRWVGPFCDPVIHFVNAPIDDMTLLKREDGSYKHAWLKLQVVNADNVKHTLFVDPTAAQFRSKDIVTWHKNNLEPGQPYVAERTHLNRGLIHGYFKASVQACGMEYGQCDSLTRFSY